MTSTRGLETVYDDFVGPDLDPDRWMYLERPLPDGSLHRAAEPEARVGISEGTLSISVDRFRTSHDTLQTVDNTKHMLFSTAEFPLPQRGMAVFEIRQTARQIGAADLDHLLGLAVFNTMDLATGLTFDVAVGDRHVFAVHERFDSDPMAPPLFTHLVESPFLVATRPGQRHRLKITFDTANHVVTWAVNDISIYNVSDAVIPSAVRIGLGLLTGVKLTDRGSASLQGQGLHATWSPPTITISSEAPAVY